MRKFQKTQKDCGVTLRTKDESEQRIKERLIQLKLEGKTDSKEYELLTLLLERIHNPVTLH